MEPRTETEIRLATIIKELLKLDSLTVNDNFFRAGGSSIQAVSIISSIRNEFNLDLDIKCFFVFPTVRELSQHLESLSSNNISEKEGATLEIPDAENTIFTSSILPLRRGNRGIPLYIVCGGGGTAFTFQNFAYMLDEGQAVYVFQPSYNSAELENFPVTIETIADKYISELLSVNPHGPYALSGHCIGGAIALEMARKLRPTGREVRFLAMFDVILTKNHLSVPAAGKKMREIPAMLKKATLNAYLRVDFHTFLLTRHPKDAMEYKINKLKAFFNKIFQPGEEDVELALFKKFERIFETAFANYHIRKYDEEIFVFYASEHYHFWDKVRNIQFRKLTLEDDIRSAWKDYGEPVIFHEVEGEHSTIFQSKDFARLLQSYLP